MWLRQGLRANLSILVSHVECAAFELPFGDGETFGKLDIAGVLKFLEEEKLLHHSQDKWYWTSDAYPADGVSLRSISSDNFVVVDAKNFSNLYFMSCSSVTPDASSTPR